MNVVAENKVDTVEKFLADGVNAKVMELVNCELVHTFTPGLYSRQITMPEGVIVVSEIHLTEHQYNISEGLVEVWTEGKGWEVLMAPYNGVTKAGTRRILKVLMKTVWTTYHATELKTVDEIYDAIIDKRVNPLIGGHFKNNVFQPQETMIDK